MFKFIPALILFILTAFVSAAEDAGDKLTAKGIYMYDAIYPAAHSLEIPFHGYVELNRKPWEKAGEYWINVDHLVKTKHFKNVCVLVDHEGVILGGKASFDGTRKEWETGKKGIHARLEVINAFVGGEEDFHAKMKQPFQMYNVHGGFGGMVFSFHSQGVSWRKHHKMVKTLLQYKAMEHKAKEAAQPTE